MAQTCFYPGCDEEAKPQRFDGQPYCAVHYDQMIRERFWNEYSQWKRGDEPAQSLKYIFARYVSEYYRGNLPGMLSSARIRDRGENFMKTEDGLTFEIVRHEGAWTRSIGNLVRQRYNYNIKNKELTLLEESEEGTFCS